MIGCITWCVGGCKYLSQSQMNNYIVRSLRDVIVVTSAANRFQGYGSHLGS